MNKDLSKEKVIFALDVPTREEALDLVEELRSEVGGFKIGLQLFSSLGPSFVRELTSQGIRIFLDVKFHDIPNTVAAASVEVARMGVWMFNVHASGGFEMMRKARLAVDEVCERESLTKPLMIGVTALTSLSDDELNEIGFSKPANDLATSLAILAHSAGLDGVVSSGHEAGSIKSATTDEFLVVTPGVRPAFATNDDQRRVVTPETAVRNGADFLVLGRAIRSAGNRVEAARAVAGEIVNK